MKDKTSARGGMNPFRTSDIAEFMGMTNMGVHYLEKQGFLTAERGENGYRAYSVETVTRLGILRSYERMGFSLREADRLPDESADGVRQALRGRREELLRQLEMVDRKLEDLTDGAVVTDRLTEENCRFETSPRMYYCPVWEEAYDMEKVSAPERRAMRDVDISWLAAMPFMRYCSRVTEENGVIRSEKGNCIEADHAQGVVLNHLTPEVPSARCLYFRFCGMEFGRMTALAREFLAERGFEAVLPAYAPVLHFGDDGELMLNEMRIPVREVGKEERKQPENP